MQNMALSELKADLCAHHRASRYWLGTARNTVAFAALALTLPSVASAAEDQKSSDNNDIVVVATKTDAPVIEAPQSVSIITSEEMALRGVVDLNGALSYSTGIKFRDYPGTPAIQDFYLRGFRANVNGESVYRDGLRQQYGGFTGNVEPYGLERIELLKGPASVLYGQGNPGGLINLTTKRPTEATFHQVQAQVGSYGRYQAAVDFGGPVTDDGTLLYRVTGLVRDAGLQYQYGRDDRIYIAPAVTWRPSSSSTLTLLGTYFQTDGSGSEQSYPAIGTIFPNPNGQLSSKLFLGDPIWNHTQLKYRSIGYVFNTELADRLKLNQVVRYSDARTFFHNISDRSLGLLVNNRTEARGANDRHDHERQFSADTNLLYDINTGDIRHKILAGVDYSRVRYQLRQLNGTPPILDLYNPTYYGAIVWNAALSRQSSDALNQIGLYIQDQINWGKLTLTLNGRHDNVKSTSLNVLNNVISRQKDNKFTGRAGLVYELDNGIAPYLSYSTSFQPTTQTAFDGSLFKPTQGEQIEGGLKYQPRGSKTSITATVYQLTQTNVATPDILHAGFNVQQGEVRSRGFELEGRTKIGHAINLIFAYAHTDAKISKANPNAAGVSSEGLRQLGVPRNSASGWIDYSFSDALEGLNVGGGVRYIGPAYNTPNTILFPGYTLFDVAVHYTTGPYKISVNANNVFNKDYYNPGFYPNSVYYGYKRSLLATLTYDF